MKRSTAVVLVLSGAMLSGCSKREQASTPAERTAQVLTNDTYIEGRGYYHSPFHTFFPFPYNYYRPGIGYYRGGQYHAQPDLARPEATYPGKSYAKANDPSVNRGGFTRTGSSRGWHPRSVGS